MQVYSVHQKKEFAAVFDALGHPRRIAIFLVLKRAGVEGVTFGVLAKQANIADPSLSHHIRMMKKCGMVKSNTKGQFTVFTLDLSATRQVLQRLGLA
ncbi:MAG: helix-turn-helix domain-containing protein [Robiginitomaculum sp.]|nr:helix-turn-helix domain-containing protein [Robiginitomaculum sp.]